MTLDFCPHCQGSLRDWEQFPPLPSEWFDSQAHEVVVGEARRHVRPTVWRLLLILWERRGLLVSRDALMLLLYGGSADEPETKIIDVNIYHLRRALDGTPYSVRTIWSQGVRLEGPADG